MKTLIILSVTVLGLFLISPIPCQAHSGQTAYAVPISGITVDGNLNDWPEGLHEYPIEWVSPSSRKISPPDGPEDFLANFRAGYDPMDNVLYVAVVINDEDLVIYPDNPGPFKQDFCGIYVDGDHSGGDSKSHGRQFYVMVPGQGRWSKKVNVNPALNEGDTEASGIRGAYSQNGDVIVYEWSISLFDNFPEQRSQVQAGKTIGFDILIGDADAEDKANYVFWTPGASKSRNSDFFGHLLLLNSYEDLGSIRGTVSEEGKGSLQAGLLIDIYQGNQMIVTVS